jgi:hypothetical protein
MPIGGYFRTGTLPPLLPMFVFQLLLVLVFLLPEAGSIQALGQRQNDPAQIAPAPAASATHARSVKWLYTIVLPPAAGLLLLTGIACFLLPCRKTAAATIGPWKTGLSGHLQKAFVTGSTTTFFAKSGCMLEILLYYYMQIRKHCKNQVLSCSLLILQ